QSRLHRHLLPFPTRRSSDLPGLKAMDAVIQGMSGSAMTTGTPADGPLPTGYAIADVTTPLFAVIGILAALERRRRTGRGEFVDRSEEQRLNSSHVKISYAVF